MGDKPLSGTRTSSSALSRRGMLAGGIMACLNACSIDGKSGLIRGESSRVVRISDGDQFFLETGLAVRLAEIEAPRSREPFGSEAAEALERIAIGRKVTLFYGGLTRDRHERALAHALIQDEAFGQIWANGFLVRQGVARARSHADNQLRIRRLYSLEEEARTRKAGLWGEPVYRPIMGSNANLKGRFGFTLAQGRLEKLTWLGTGEGRAYLRDGQWTLELPWALSRSELRTLLDIGQRLRVRGNVRQENSQGPYIVYRSSGPD